MEQALKDVGAEAATGAPRRRMHGGSSLNTVIEEYRIEIEDEEGVRDENGPSWCFPGSNCATTRITP
jgi:hypothetical protein